jgi:tetratricopeptide (TPR) repeat protein
MPRSGCLYSFSFAKIMCKFTLPIAVFCSLLGGAILTVDSLADDSDIIYGKGVHAFFDNKYEEAVTILSEAEKMESDDPRPFYFMGLSYLRQKKSEQADQYFEKAAQREYSGRALQDYEVSESLRRIQGEERQRIEKIRTAERLNAAKRERQLQELRYGKETAAAREALRQSTARNQQEDLATLQAATEGFGDNVFGLKPIEPVGTQERSIARRSVDSNPFGGVQASMTEIVLPRDRTGTAVIRSRGNVGGQSAPSTSSLIGGVAAAVGENAPLKELGKGLGTFFARRTSTAENPSEDTDDNESEPDEVPEGNF